MALVILRCIPARTGIYIAKSKTSTYLTLDELLFVSNGFTTSYYIYEPLVESRGRSSRPEYEGFIYGLETEQCSCLMTSYNVVYSTTNIHRFFICRYQLSLTLAENMLVIDTCVNFRNLSFQVFTSINPGTFLKTADHEGSFIRKYVPELEHFPEEFIYEPWLAPLSVQEAANCVIGRDYPSPIVQYEKAAVENMEQIRKITDDFLRFN